MHALIEWKGGISKLNHKTNFSYKDHKFSMEEEKHA
jgi:hypothetical protein